MGVSIETAENPDSKEFSRTSSRDDLSSNIDDDALGSEMVRNNKFISVHVVSQILTGGRNSEEV